MVGAAGRGLGECAAIGLLLWVTGDDDPDGSSAECCDHDLRR